MPNRRAILGTSETKGAANNGAECLSELRKTVTLIPNKTSNIFAERITMGYYIQTNAAHNKADYIVGHYDGEFLAKAPSSYEDIPQGKALIAIVDNGPFEAAGFCYSKSEFEAFTNPSDPRPIQYVLIDRDLAEYLTNF